MLNKSFSNLEFNTPKISDYDKIMGFLAPFAEETMSCEITPLTLLIWKDYYHQKVAFCDDMMFVSLGEEQDIFLLPFAKDMEKAVNILLDYTKNRNQKLVFLAADGPRLDKFNHIFSDVFSQIESRDDYEYLYLTENLKNLSGKKYHSKRNHISAFSKNYNWSYETMSADNLDEIFEMMDNWTKTMCQTVEDCQSIQVENAAMKELLPKMDMLKLKGGCIRVDGKIIAFSFGSPINNWVFDIHVEKALPEFRTAYALINRELISHELMEYKYVNREDDMGLEGLRKAKLSYHPDILLKKYVLEEH